MVSQEGIVVHFGIVIEALLALVQHGLFQQLFQSHFLQNQRLWNIL
jgi:hypothetical protein